MTRNKEFQGELFGYPFRVTSQLFMNPSDPENPSDL